MKRTKKITKFGPKMSLLLLVGFLCVSVISVFAQTPPPKSPLPPKPKVWKTSKKILNENPIPAEKSIAVDANVNISLCVEAGNLKINGWQRDEIRAFVLHGSQVGFKVLQKGRQSGKPVWVMTVGFDPSKNTEAEADECLSGEEIQIDVPRNATVNVKSRESETTMDSIRKVRVENVGGDIILRNIAQGIEAKTYEGDVMVEKSGGAMALLSTTGNIVAFDASPSEIGDIFRAKTSSGSITLKQIAHRQTEVGSNSGSISFTGEFAIGGQYNFGTSNGSITLLIPPNSSSKITASYGFGEFSSDIPLEKLVKSAQQKAQNLTGQIGKGDASINLTTYSGALRIRKQ